MTTSHKNRVLETVTTVGAGAYTLGGAVVGYQTALAAGCLTGETYGYFAEAIDANGALTGAFEVGEGTYTAGVLTSTSVSSSSNMGAKVSWLAGTKRIGLTLTAETLASLASGGGSVDLTTAPVSAAQAAAIGAKANTTALDAEIARAQLAESGKASQATTYTKIEDDANHAQTVLAIGAKADKATTLAGYGITDSYTGTVIDGKLSALVLAAGGGGGIADYTTMINKPDFKSGAFAVVTGTNTGDQVIPATLPASDVSAWAKAATKPSYTLVELGAQAAGTYASGSGSASGANTGDETATTIKTKLGVTVLTGSNSGDQVIPTTLPASDVSAWAKTPAKPAYTASEVGAAATSHVHGAATNLVDGFFTSAEKAKLAGIATGATVGLSATTLAGYGITDAYTKTQSDSNLAAVVLAAGSGGGIVDWAAITNKPSFGTGALLNASGVNTGDQVIPTTLPASDVYTWAKAATKPSYTLVELGAQASGTYATGTGTASGTNTGDETVTTIKTKLGVSVLTGSNTGDQVIPTTLPASDVSAWAKSPTRPTYTATDVGAQVAGTYATGTGSASGANTGDETLATIKTKLGITTLSGSNTGDQVLPTLASLGAQAAGIYATGTGSASGINTGDQVIPTTLPASDVSTWAKAATRPTYTASDVGAAEVVHTHSYQAADGDLLAIGGLVGNNGILRKTAADTWTLDTATYATGAGSASGVNTADETTATIRTKLGVTTLSGSNTGDKTLAELGGFANPMTSQYQLIMGGVGGVPSAFPVGTTDLQVLTNHPNGVTSWQLPTPGKDGVSPVMSIGTVTTLAPGLPASATFSGTPAEPILNINLATQQEALESMLVNRTAGAAGTLDVNLSDSKMFYWLLPATANFIINARSTASVTLNSLMAIDEVRTAIVLARQGSTAYFCNTIKIDGILQDVMPAMQWDGGATPTGGNALAVDSYTLVILKTANATFQVFAGQTIWKK